jgi:hypothetical protein
MEFGRGVRLNGGYIGCWFIFSLVKVLLWAAHFHLFVEQFPTLVALLLSLSEFGRGLDS